MQPGTEVLTARGEPMLVTRIAFTTRTERVYNFGVQEFRSYFVGESGVWVHNCNADEVLSKAFGKNAGKLYECKSCAEDGAKALKEAGISGKRVRVESQGPVGWKKSDGSFMRLGENGEHEWLEVGGKVYDNMNPNGIAKEEFKRRLQRSPGANWSKEVVDEW